MYQRLINTLFFTLHNLDCKLTGVLECCMFDFQFQFGSGSKCTLFSLFFFFFSFFLFFFFVLFFFWHLSVSVIYKYGDPPLPPTPPPHTLKKKALWHLFYGTLYQTWGLWTLIFFNKHFDTCFMKHFIKQEVYGHLDLLFSLSFFILISPCTPVLWNILWNRWFMEQFVKQVVYGTRYETHGLWTLYRHLDPFFISTWTHSSWNT